MASWQIVYKTEIQHRAEIVKSVLEEKQLKPILVNKTVSAYRFGHYEVMVMPDYVLKALKIIEDEIIFE